jgi:hypothetical protein
VLPDLYSIVANHAAALVVLCYALPRAYLTLRAGSIVLDPASSKERCDRALAVLRLLYWVGERFDRWRRPRR